MWVNSILDELQSQKLHGQTHLKSTSEKSLTNEEWRSSSLFASARFKGNYCVNKETRI